MTGDASANSIVPAAALPSSLVSEIGGRPRVNTILLCNSELVSVLARAAAGPNTSLLLPLHAALEGTAPARASQLPQEGALEDFRNSHIGSSIRNGRYRSLRPSWEHCKEPRHAAPTPSIHSLPIEQVAAASFFDLDQYLQPDEEPEEIVIFDENTNYGFPFDLPIVLPVLQGAPATIPITIAPPKSSSRTRAAQDELEASTSSSSSSVSLSASSVGLSTMATAGNNAAPLPREGEAPKEEPASRSGSEGGGVDLSTRPPLPPCAICTGESTGIHFGVEACAACSAFFRRTVVLEREYHCGKDGRCVILKEKNGRCRSCRFKKCVAVGMDSSGGLAREYELSPMM